MHARAYGTSPRALARGLVLCSAHARALDETSVHLCEVTGGESGACAYVKCFAQAVRHTRLLNNAQ
eukprot:4966979-Pleurochrysis_carterae.AAC.2